MGLRAVGGGPAARTADVRWRGRVVGNRYAGPAESLNGWRRGAACRWRLRQRRLLHNAWRVNDPRPHVYVRRRCAWGWTGWSCGGHQLWDVAAAFRRRRQRHWRVARHRTHPVHDYRGDASRVLRCGGWTDLRRRSATQREPADPRQGLGHRRPRGLALHHGPLEARPVGGGGDESSALGAATDPRGRRARNPAAGSPGPGVSPTRRSSVSQEPIHARARAPGHIATASTIRATPPRDPGYRRAGP